MGEAERPPRVRPSACRDRPDVRTRSSRRAALPRLLTGTSRRAARRVWLTRPPRAVRVPHRAGATRSRGGPSSSRLSGSGRRAATTTCGAGRGIDPRPTARVPARAARTHHHEIGRRSEASKRCTSPGDRSHGRVMRAHSPDRRAPGWGRTHLGSRVRHAFATTVPRTTLFASARDFSDTGARPRRRQHDDDARRRRISLSACRGSPLVASGLGAESRDALPDVA